MSRLRVLQALRQASTVPPKHRVSLLSRFSLTAVVERVLTRTDLVSDADLRRLVSGTVATGLYVGAGAAVFAAVGSDTSPIVTGLGVTGISAGFAARDVIGNYISGWVLLLTRPFLPGEFICIGRAADMIEGTVDKMDMRYVYLNPYPGTGNIIMVPNNVVLNSVLRKTQSGTPHTPVPPQHGSAPSLSTATTAPKAATPAAGSDANPEWQALLKAAYGLDGLTETLLRSHHAEALRPLSLDEQKVYLWLLARDENRTSKLWEQFVAKKGKPEWAPV